MIGPEDRALAELGAQAVSGSCMRLRSERMLRAASRGEGSESDLLEIACLAGVDGGVIRAYAASLGLTDQEAAAVEGIAMAKVMANIGREVSGREG